MLETRSPGFVNAGEMAAVAKASDDKQARLAKALRDNLHRRKAQSRARNAAEGMPQHMTDGPASTEPSHPEMERDHGQLED